MYKTEEIIQINMSTYGIVIGSVELSLVSFHTSLRFCSQPNPSNYAIRI